MSASGRVSARGSQHGPCSGKAGAGFTLIELLVVIAVIALLMAILVPVLHRAREAGKRAVCMGHLRQMQIAWHAYAVDHDGFIVCGIPFQWVEHPPGTPWLSASDAVWGPSRAEVDAAMRTGALASYVGNVSVYRCPSQFELPGAAGWSEAKRWRSPYGIVTPMNCWPPDIVAGFEAAFTEYHGPSEIRLCITRLSELNPPGAAYRMVFLDVGCPLWNLVPPDYEIMGANPRRSGGWTQAEAGHGPPLHHSMGTCMSFADGRVEYWKWKDPRTIEWAQDWLDFYRGGPKPFTPLKPSLEPENPDYVELFRAVWGRRP